MSQFLKSLANVSSLALLAAGFASAQEAETAPAEGTRVLDTVTVTATQREASVQDVPIAVTALSPEELDRAGVLDIKRLDSVAPSFSMNSSDTESGGTTLRLRGVGTTGNNIGLESSVGVFLDGVYLSRPGVALADLLDLQQIEVLRGPQGTLFGRNTSAGALNIKTQRPDLDEMQFFANISAGDYGLINPQAGVNIPVVKDKFAIRLSAAMRDQDGFVTGANGSESNTRDRELVRGQALWNLANLGEIRMIADWSKGGDECCDAVWSRDGTQRAAFAPAGLGATGGAPNIGADALENYQSNSENFFNPFEQWGASLEYSADSPLGKFTYIGSFRNYESGGYRNTDYTGLNIFTVGPSPEARALGGTNFDPNAASTIETSTHEIRLQNTAFNDRLDWLVGAYYSDEQIDAQGSLTLLDQYQSGVSAGILGSATNSLLAFAGGANARGDFATNAFAQSATSSSIFTHNVLSLTDQLSFTLGVRYVEESKDGSYDQLGGQHNACLGTFGNIANVPAALRGTAIALNCFIFAAPAVRVGGTGVLDSNATALVLLPREFANTFADEEVVYTANAAYKFTSDVNAYLSYSHGFKSGGFNLDASAAVGGLDPRFKSEKIDAVEIGLKADLFNGRARANFAAFQQEMEDFQVLEFTGIQFQTFNVDKAQSYGFELELLGQLTENFTGTLGITYADAEYPADCASLNPASPRFNRSAAALCGNELTNSPDLVTILGGTYERAVGSSGMNFFVNGSMRSESERRTSTQAREVPSAAQVNAGLADVRAVFQAQPRLPDDYQDANTKINLRIGLEAEDDRWGIELWGNNITDERTKNVTFNIPLRGSAGNRARGQFVQEPASYGVTLRTRY